ncbi:methyltransferase-like protein 23-like [Achlya hypogyna]|uniref:Methyltransferase-like protein 23-like n=1 Tax=Achlya hypogyna TaxID=1202772 RepID=A0A1V9YX40_ACHHY|nr:methyltransferase-like protein 23-like [Achlya hypogyna]
MRSDGLVKTFAFEQCQVVVREELGLSATVDSAIDLGWYVWPSAVTLATFLSKQPQLVISKRVLELGAGTALPGLLAAKLGATHVLLTDKNPDDLTVAQQGIALNHLNPARITTATLTWGTTVSLGATVDVVLAADCFYDPKDFEDVVATLASVVRANPQCVCYVAYQLRR